MIFDWAGLTDFRVPPGLVVTVDERLNSDGLFFGGGEGGSAVALVFEN
jgi:hypothetical protein